MTYSMSVLESPEDKLVFKSWPDAVLHKWKEAVGVAICLAIPVLNILLGKAEGAELIGATLICLLPTAIGLLGMAGIIRYGFSHIRDEDRIELTQFSQNNKK